MSNESKNKFASSHYGQSYFTWQSDIGEFGGWANAPLFRAFIKSGDSVLDFGCGGGWLLKNITCQRRLGVEVNPVAADVARKNGLEIFDTVTDVPDLAANVVISNHALEHVLHPLHELISLRPKLQPGGQAVFIVPCENTRTAYFPNDINHHLYTWNPMSLGNLFSEAGYLIVESRPLMHKWSVKFRLLARASGRRAFDLASWFYAHLGRSSFQVRIIARTQ